MQYRAFLLVLGIAAGTLLCSAQTGNQVAPPSPFPDNEGQLGPSVTGTVVDATGRPLHDIRIEVRSLSNAGLEQTCFSAADGTFRFRHLRPGNYEVVSTNGMREATQQVSVRSGETNVDLRMSSGAVNSQRSSVSVAQLKVPGKARRLMEKARNALEKRRPEETGKYVEAALNIAPDFAEALTLRASLEMDVQHNDAALEDLDHAIKADPSFGPAYLVMGALLNQRGRFDEALRSLDHGSTFEPKSWQCSFEMAKAWLGKHNYEHALQQLKRTEMLGGAKMLGAIHILRGYALLGEKQFDQASREFQAYLDSEPKGELAGHVRMVMAQVKTQLSTRGSTVPLPAVSGILASPH